MGSKKNKKSNFKDTSAEVNVNISSHVTSLNGTDADEAERFTVGNDAVNFGSDPAQIDLEDQIAEEKEYKPRFKVEGKEIILNGVKHDSNTLTETDVITLIDADICTPNDFV
jgi:hypothetical protein